MEDFIIFPRGVQTGLSDGRGLSPFCHHLDSSCCPLLSRAFFVRLCLSEDNMVLVRMLTVRTDLSFRGIVTGLDEPCCNSLPAITAGPLTLNIYYIDGGLTNFSRHKGILQRFRGSEHSEFKSNSAFVPKPRGGHRLVISSGRSMTARFVLFQERDTSH